MFLELLLQLLVLLIFFEVVLFEIERDTDVDFSHFQFLKLLLGGRVW